MLHIHGLLARSGARLPNLELGLAGFPSHTSGHMGVELTRLLVSMPSSTMACRIGCNAMADLTKFLFVLCVLTLAGFQREVTVVMDPFEYFLVAQMISGTIVSQCRHIGHVECNSCIFHVDATTGSLSSNFALTTVGRQGDLGTAYPI